MAGKVLYVCSNCDAQHPKWSGRCLECGKWGTLQETQAQAKKSSKSTLGTSGKKSASVTSLASQLSHEVKYISGSGFPANTIFKKGIVAGSVTLLSGEPGAGKSTLSLQLGQNFSADNTVLYISAEESISQIHDRGSRIGANSKKLLISESNDLEEVIATVSEHVPAVVIIDSLQTITSAESESELGSIQQVKIVTAKLSQMAKDFGVAVIAIGHVTKDGALAGPKSLEHLVDAVYYLESDRASNYRLLRSFKNRYGESGKVLVMRLSNSGLIEVKDASTIFIKNFKPKPGSVLTITVIENQPFFLEVQSLVTKTSYGYAKRTVSGFSKSRLEMLLAIISKKLHIDCDQFDVYINIAGGFNVSEPAMDLAVVLSIVSSIKEESLPNSAVAFGEVGLSGELRVVKDTSTRLTEAAQNNFSHVYVPALESKIKSSSTVHAHDSISSLIAELGW